MGGIYTEITGIVAPDSAAQGEKVDVSVKVKNSDNYSGHHLWCVAIVDGLRFIDQKVIIPAGLTYSYLGSFLMAAGDATIYVSTYYPYFAEWLLDDEARKDIALAEVFEGTITKKELDYEDRWQTFPLYSIPFGTRTRVRIAGRNDMASNQKMGIWLQVKDPDGQVAEQYARWEIFWTGPGLAQEFTSGSFDLNKAGTYTIAVQLFMNQADQVVVDSYYGDLCAVPSAEEFAGTISRKELKYDSTTEAIPAY